MTDPIPPTSTRWSLLAETLKAQRRNLTIGTLIGLAWTVGKVASPVLVRFGIDRGIRNDDLLWLWAGLIGVAGTIAGLFTALRRFYAFREARWTETRLREQLFGHIMSLHIGYHDRAQTGQLMSRSSSDLNSIQMFVVMIPITLSNLAMITAVVVILFMSRHLTINNVTCHRGNQITGRTRFNKMVFHTLIELHPSKQGGKKAKRSTDKQDRQVTVNDMNEHRARYHTLPTTGLGVAV